MVYVPVVTIVTMVPWQVNNHFYMASLGIFLRCRILVYKKPLVVLVGTTARIRCIGLTNFRHVSSTKLASTFTKSVPMKKLYRSR